MVQNQSVRDTGTCTQCLPFSLAQNMKARRGDDISPASNSCAPPAPLAPVADHALMGAMLMGAMLIAPLGAS